MANRGQALADFIAEFTYSNATEVIEMINSAEAARVRERKDFIPTEGDIEQWILYVDNASNDTGFGAGMMLISLEGHKIHCAICFGFKTSNNEAEYEVRKSTPLLKLRYLQYYLQCKIKREYNTQ